MRAAVLHLIAATAVLTLCTATFAALPKIGCRSGTTNGDFYYVSTGKTFYPEGNNYIRLDTGGNQFHFTFNDGAYDAAGAESALTQMQAFGYNVVRVWIDATQRATNYGIGGPASRNVVTLWPNYMNNFLDFLRRATAHNVYVIVALDYFPGNTYYYNVYYAQQLPNVTGWNTYFLSPGGVETKRQYVKELATEVQAADTGNLVNTVLCWELNNELFVTTADQPFSLGAGTVQTATGSYNMAVAADRQNCMDANLGSYVLTCAAAIREIIPDAVVNVSLFTNRAVGHAGFNGLLPISTPDQRWPARAYWLSQYSGISYIDFHTYPSGAGYTIADDLNSMEWSLLDHASKPYLIGEMGAYKPYYPDVVAAALMLRDHRASLYSTYGFKGALLWSWDSVSVTDYWSCLESAGCVNGVLAPCVRWKNYEFNGTGGNLDGWTPISQMMNATTNGSGYLYATVTGNHPYMHSPSSLSIDTKYVRKVAVRIKNATNGTSIGLYWTTNADPTWNETKAIHMTETANSGSFVEYVFDLWNNPAWTGTVSQIRIDPAELWSGTLSGTVYIDYVHAMDW